MDQTFRFESTDAVINTLVGLSSEPTVRFELQFDSPIDLERLKSAVSSLLNYEPVLGSGIVFGDKPYYKSMSVSADDVVKCISSQNAYEVLKAEKVDVEHGPLISIVLFNSDSSSKLLFKAAHEATDGFGLITAVKHIASVYRFDSNPVVAPIVRGGLSRSPRRLLKSFSWRDYPKLIALNVKEKFGYFFPKGTMSYGAGEPSLESPEFVSMRLGADSVQALKRLAVTRNATINDALLTLFLRSLAFNSGFSGDQALRILLTIDLRRYIRDESIDSSEICNLSAMECVNIKRILGAKFVDTLDRVSAVTRKKKDAGIGLSFIMDLLINDKLKFQTIKSMNQSTRDMVIKTENYAVTVTNVGVLDPESLRFDSVPEDVAVFGPLAYSPFWCFAITGYNGELKISTSLDSKRKPYLEKIFQELDAQVNSALSQ